MRFLIINGEKIYNANSSLTAFIMGSLLELGVEDEKELKELGEISSWVYMKGERLDIGDITDYVYEHRDTIRDLSPRDIIEKIVEAQW